MKTVALPLILLAAPAAAGTFTPPQGCKTYLTVQAHGCLVSQMYTCEADPAGDQWRADFSADGPVFLSKIDAETQWIESYEINPPTKETLDPNPKDPASFTELMATGLDTFDFGLTKSDGSHTNVKGYDKLTGQTATIDGVVLQQTEYEYTQTDDQGTVLRHSKGNEYVSTEWRTFLSGKSQWEEADGTWLPSDNTAVKFYRPGDAGFEQTVPLFDCNAESAGLTLPGPLEALRAAANFGEEVTMRRLDLHPAKRLRGTRRHARAFHAAMDRLDALTPPQAGERFANFKVPAFQKALSPLHGAPAFRRDVVARLIASADRMARRTPARVAALIDWPDLFGSEVCVFFDADAARAWDPRHRAAEPHPARTEWMGGWVEARVPAHDLLADLGLDVPEGFAAHGTELVEYDRDADIVTTREEWVVMDIRFPAERSLP